MSTPASRKRTKAAAVAHSKKVGSKEAVAACSSPTVRRTVSTAVASASVSTIDPRTTNRSSSRSRCGDVYRALRWPAKWSAVSSIAVTEPLPLVPAICTGRKARCGWPSAVVSLVMFSRPNFMPRRSRASSQASESVNGRSGWRGDRGGFWRRRREIEAGLVVSAPGPGRRHRGKQPPERVLQLAAIHHHVEHAAFEQELAALEAFGQLLPDRLLDDARTREADERLRLRNVDIAEHR